MVFMRRKSIAAADGEESRPRNRLSKPMTGKSPPNQKSTSGKHSPKAGSQSVSSSSSRMSLAEISRTASKKELGVQKEEQALVVEDVIAPKPPVANIPKRKNGVASLVMQFESVASASQTSLTLPPPPVPPKSSFTSYASNRLTGVQQEQQMQSREKLHRKSISTIASPTESVEQIVDSVAIPQRRPSTYRPGEATRKSSVEDKSVSSRATEAEPKFDLNKPLPTVTQELQREAIHEQWSPRPPIARTETPSSLQAIGPLRLGTLHIVNGRTSPVLSELSKHLISRQLRDVSSEYADSTYSKDITGEDWEDAIIADEAEDTETEEPKTPVRTAFDVDARQFTTPTPKHNNFEMAASPIFQTPARTPDKASIIAQSYRDAIQGSPFSYGSISPMSTGSVVCGEIPAPDRPELQTPVSMLTSDPIKPSTKTTNTQGTSEDQWGIYQDVTLSDDVHRKDNSNNRTMSLQSEQPSIESKPSVAETDRTRDLIFSSALEYQAPHFQPPPSPERGISPDSLHPPSIGVFCDKVDSGYNSGNSMLSLELIETTPPIQPAPLQIFTAQMDNVMKEEGPKPVSPTKEQSSPRKFGRFFPSRSPNRKSISKMPERSTPVTPTPEPIAVISTPEKKPESPAKMMKRDKEEREKAAKVQKKLQKSRPTSRARVAQEIVVQRLPSCESTLDIPAISETARANLNYRTQQIPELERTFRSQQDIKGPTNSSTLALPVVDIRFPSPMPVDDEDERSSRSDKKERVRSKSRPRSKSRRRSFLDMFRSDKRSRSQSADFRNDENELSIADFGDVVASLGSNPYDIAHSRPASRRPETSAAVPSPPKTNPHNVSNSRPQPRTSMSAEEASEFARMRSHSFNAHDEKGERKPHSNERGNILSNFRRTSIVLADDAPPVPPLPNKEELKRISQRYSMQSQFLSTPTESKQFWDASPSSDRHVGGNSARASPTRSPQPHRADRDDRDDCAIEDEVEVAPPPPSHSPAPFNIPVTPPRSHSPLPSGTENNESPWEAQARVWKARRQSAGEALRSHRQSLDLRGGEYQDGEQRAVDYEEELTYPVIPPRHPGRNTATPPEERWPFDPNDYGHQSQQHPLQHSQTWDNDDYETYDNNYETYQNSRTQCQNGQPRPNTWYEGQGHVGYSSPSYRPHDELASHVRPNLRTQNSSNSQQSFYSHHNGQIDRPFDLPPRFSADLDDEYDEYDQEEFPPSSPFRGRLPVRQDYSGYNGYETCYQPNYQTEGMYNYYDNQYDNHNVNDLQPQTIPQHPRYYAPSSFRSQHGSLIEPSVSASRPNTSLSQNSAPSHRSNISVDVPAEAVKPQQIRRRPVPAPDYGRYSGGMEYGYEGRDKGFGGSAGTRDDSGKADGMVKGSLLRESHGVDLGDVPVIGVVKRIS